MSGRRLHLSAMYSLTCLSFGGRMQSMTDLPCQTVATLRQCIVAIMSDLHLNPKITLVSDSMSTPSGCSWPTPTHNSSLSSSFRELGHNGVVSPWVATKTQIWLPMSISLPRVGFTSTKAIAVDAVKVKVWKSGQSAGCRRVDVCLGQIHRFTTIFLFNT